MKYLRVSVYRSAEYEDCSKNGVSSKSNYLYVQCEKGFDLGNDVSKELLFAPEDRGGGYWALVPVHSPNNKIVQYGGNLASTEDSRLPHVFRIHDRVE